MKRGQLAWIDSPFFSTQLTAPLRHHCTWWVPQVERWNDSCGTHAGASEPALRHQGLVTVLRGPRRPWDLQLKSQPILSHASPNQRKKDDRSNEHCDETMGATRPIERRDSPHLRNIKQHRFGGKLTPLFEPSGNPPRYRKHRFVYEEK